MGVSGLWLWGCAAAWSLLTINRERNDLSVWSHWWGTALTWCGKQPQPLKRSSPKGLQQHTLTPFSSLLHTHCQNEIEGSCIYWLSKDTVLTNHKHHLALPDPVWVLHTHAHTDTHPTPTPTPVEPSISFCVPPHSQSKDVNKPLWHSAQSDWL